MRPSHERRPSYARRPFSLLGAVEFRDVVNSLMKESSSAPRLEARTPGVFGPTGSPVVSGVGAHYHTHHTHIHPADNKAQRSASHSGIRRGDRPSPGNDGRISPGLLSEAARPDRHKLSRSRVSDKSIPQDILVDVGTSMSDPWFTATPTSSQPSGIPGPFGPDEVPEVMASSRSQQDTPSVLVLPPDDGLSLPAFNTAQESPTLSSDIPASLRLRRRDKLLRRLRLSYHALFPSLHNFRSKSMIAKGLAILAVPAILALTLTLPVVDTEADDDDSFSEKSSVAGDESDEEAALSGEEDEDDDAFFSPKNRARDVRIASGLSGHELVLGDPWGAVPESHRQVLTHAGSTDFGLDSRLLSVPDLNVSGGGGQIELTDGDEQEREACEDECEDDLKWSKELTAAQLVLGPSFCVGIIFGEFSAV